MSRHLRDRRRRGTCEIIRLYVEEGLSVEIIAERLGRSSRTSHEHIRQHNKAVERSGFCPKCRRVHGAFEGDKVRCGSEG